MSVYDWYHTISANKRFSFSKLELSIPSPFTTTTTTNNNNPLTTSNSTTTASNSVFSATTNKHKQTDSPLDSLDILLSKYFTTSRDGITFPSHVLNPFLHTISAVDSHFRPAIAHINTDTNTTVNTKFGNLSYNSNQTSNTNNSNIIWRTDRAYSNLLIMRGGSSSGQSNQIQNNLQSKLFHKCIGGVYALSSCLECPTVIKPPTRFPYLHSLPTINNNSNNDKSNNNKSDNNVSSSISSVCMNIAVAAGTDSSIGGYLLNCVDVMNGLGYSSYAIRSGGYNTTDGEVDDELLYHSNANNTSNTSSISQQQQQQQGRIRTGAREGGGVRPGGKINIRSQLEAQGLEKDECLEMIDILTECAHQFL